jgi:hypothetical protein
MLGLPHSGVRHFQAVFYPSTFFSLDSVAVPVPAQVSQAVVRLFRNKKYKFRIS